MATGTRFGPYEVRELVGTGGMGAVYRATDTHLDRDVAIKTLPESFVGDAQRVARFEREAKTLASLDHYNIAQIYGLERGAAGTALVMELVEGLTLAERLAVGPLPVEEACDIARQIALALEAAHERGVVHRDLKPANVKIRPDGVVKVLDFGLAKVIEAEGSAANRDSTDLNTPSLTQVGTILGTAAYMSPEQARGKPVDRRADIWAFGAVLYEMLTGKPAFPGEDATETTAAILKSEPDWAALPPLPAQLEAFLRQCLEKNPKNRVRDIADVRLALEGAYRWPNATAAEAQPTAASAAGARASWPARLGWVGAGAAGLLLGVVAMSYWPGEARDAAEPIGVRQLTFRNGTIGGARFASDGQVIVYGAAWDDQPHRIFTTRRDSYQSRPLDVPPASLLALSSDGALALSMGRTGGAGFQPLGPLARVDLSGGAPRTLAESVVGADWGPDGALAAVVRYVDGASELEFPPGERVAQENLIYRPRVSPDGEAVCFPVNYIAIMVVERGSAARVVADGLPRVSSCAWSPSGDEIWYAYAPTGATHTALEAIRPDGSGRRPLAVLPSWGVIEDLAPSGDVLLSLGSLRYSVHGSQSPEAREVDLSVFDASRLGYFAGSGETVAIYDNSTGSRETGSLFIRSSDGGPPVQLGTWTPLALTSDGQQLAIVGTTENSGRTSDTITLIPTGGGEPRSIRLPVVVEFFSSNGLGTNDWRLKTPDFSADGQRLLLPFARDSTGVARAYVHDLVEGWTRPVTPPGVTGPVVLSPDGRFVASNEADGLFIYAVDSGERREVPGGRDSALLARWGFDDAYVYLIESLPTAARVFRRNIETGERQFVREIGPPDPAGVTRFDLWLARDGNAYAYTLDRSLTNLFVLTNVR